MATKIVNKTEDFITAEFLRDKFDYCLDEGVFRRKSGGKGGIGAIAGSLRGDGYIRIGITCNGKFKSYSAHRLAWLYVYGVMPDCIIDHIDGNKTNNRISNLRLSDCSLNAINIRKIHSNGTSKWRGVSFHKSNGQWRSSIRRNGKSHHIGHFQSEDDAAQAYMFCLEMSSIIRGGMIVQI